MKISRIFDTSSIQFRKFLGEAWPRDREKKHQDKKKAKLPQGLNSYYPNKKLKYFRHITRMKNNQYPKILLEGTIHGTRPRGRPEKKWIDDIKAFCLEKDIQTVSAASDLAMNREVWRHMLVGKPSPGDHPGGRL